MVEQEGEADLKLNTKCALCVMLFMWLMDMSHTRSQKKDSLVQHLAQQFKLLSGHPPMRCVQAILMTMTGWRVQLVLLLHWQTAVATLHVDYRVEGQAWAVLPFVSFIMWMCVLMSYSPSVQCPFWPGCRSCRKSL